MTRWFCRQHRRTGSPRSNATTKSLIAHRGPRSACARTRENYASRAKRPAQPSEEEILRRGGGAAFVPIRCVREGGGNEQFPELPTTPGQVGSSLALLWVMQDAVRVIPMRSFWGVSSASESRADPAVGMVDMQLALPANQPSQLRSLPISQLQRRGLHEVRIRSRSLPASPTGKCLGGSWTAERSTQEGLGLRLALNKRRRRQRAA